MIMELTLYIIKFSRSRKNWFIDILVIDLDDLIDEVP